MLVVLLVIAAAALRGYLPGSVHTSREGTTEHPLAWVAVVALLIPSLAVIAMALVARLRHRRMAAANAGRSEWSRDGAGRPAWRLVLIGLGLVVAYLVIVWLLTRLLGPLGVSPPPPGPGQSTSTARPGHGTAPSLPPAPPRTGQSLLGYLNAIAITFLLLLAGGAVVAARRQRRASQPPALADDHGLPVPAVGPESLARAAELGLAEIENLSREPREAIIACYAVMERELENVPGAVPQECDTASEVLARAVEHHALHAESATQLVDLFAEARFSPHVMNEGHREIAVRAIQLVLTELRSVA
jgi:Domain of unknown function (DUF4129)